MTPLPVTVLRPAAADLPLPLTDVMRNLGYREGVTRVEERHIALVETAMDRARALAEPAAALLFAEVCVAPDEVTLAAGGLSWRSLSLARLLREAPAVTLVALTLGPAVEQETERLFRADEYALATALDAAGSILVHGLGQYVRSHLGAEAASHDPDLAPGALFGPGYGDWPIDDQPALTVLAGGPLIGLTCTELCYLKPQKSLVGLMGWLPSGARSRPPANPCRLCAKAECAYRERARR